MTRTLLLLALGGPLLAQHAPANAEWNRPVKPFRVTGNLYYVGVADVSSYLFTTPQGHILLDGAFQESVPLIEANIRALGFRVEDIRILLNSHAHYDHAAGLAGLKARSKARLFAHPADAAALRSGGKGDPHYGDRLLFPPVEVDGMLHDGQTIALGGLTLTAHFTPGHTRGCTTWTTTIGTSRVVIPCSVSAPEYQLVNNAKYPEIASDYRRTFARLRALPCDIFLGLHSWDFGRRADAGRVDYLRYLDRGEAAFNEQLKKQSAR